MTDIQEKIREADEKKEVIPRPEKEQKYEEIKEENLNPLDEVEEFEAKMEPLPQRKPIDPRLAKIKKRGAKSSRKKRKQSFFKGLMNGFNHMVGKKPKNTTPKFSSSVPTRTSPLDSYMRERKNSAIVTHLPKRVEPYTAVESASKIRNSFVGRPSRVAPKAPSIDAPDLAEFLVNQNVGEMYYFE